MQSTLYVLLHLHRYSQETFVSLYILSCIVIIARLFFTCIFIYFSSRTSLACSLTQSLNNQLAPRVTSTEREFEISGSSINKNCKLQVYVSIIMIIYAGLLSVVEFSYLVIASCTPRVLGCCSYSLHDCL